MPLTVHVTWFPRDSGKEQTLTLVEAAPTAHALLEVLGVLPDTVLVVRDGTPIPLDTQLWNGDTVRLVRTVSGG